MSTETVYKSKAAAQAEAHQLPTGHEAAGHRSLLARWTLQPAPPTCSTSAARAATCATTCAATCAATCASAALYATFHATFCAVGDAAAAKAAAAARGS